MDVKLTASWKTVLEKEFSKPYFENLVVFLKTEKAQGKIIYPPGKLIFNAFNSTPFDAVKVVIIGQDPYHGAGQAQGLSFSVSPGMKAPPSLTNIFKELKTDLGVDSDPYFGDLSHWAEQGVLLLNAALTVRSGEAFSHARYGWATFTDEAIKAIDAEREGIIFMLWGKFAQQKKIFIDPSKHYLLEAAHPSPFSADKGFFGCRHFSKANQILIKTGRTPIDWKLNPPLKKT